MGGLLPSASGFRVYRSYHTAWVWKDLKSGIKSRPINLLTTEQRRKTYVPWYPPPFRVQGDVTAFVDADMSTQLVQHTRVSLAGAAADTRQLSFRIGFADQRPRPATAAVRPSRDDIEAVRPSRDDIERLQATIADDHRCLGMSLEKRVCTVVRRICVLYSRRVWAGSSSVYVIPALQKNTLCGLL